MKVVLNEFDEEVELKESIDTADADWNSIMGSDNMSGDEENYAAHGYTQQEVEGEEFVNIEEDTDFDMDDDFGSDYDDDEM